VEEVSALQKDRDLPPRERNEGMYTGSPSRSSRSSPPPSIASSSSFPSPRTAASSSAQPVSHLHDLEQRTSDERAPLILRTPTRPPTRRPIQAVHSNGDHEYAEDGTGFAARINMVSEKVVRFMRKIETDNEPGLTNAQLMLTNFDLKPGELSKPLQCFLCMNACSVIYASRLITRVEASCIFNLYACLCGALSLSGLIVRKYWIHEISLVLTNRS
jgi:hypothetical protein